jgi:hypothetical protein
VDLIDLAWQAEQACLNAWPSPRQVLFNGWLLRLSGGPTRRTNSVNPLRSTDYDPRPVLDACAEIYKASGQPLIFRVPTIAEGMDATLEALGFAAQAQTRTLFADIGRKNDWNSDALEISEKPSRAWLGLASAPK